MTTGIAALIVAAGTLAKGAAGGFVAMAIRLRKVSGCYTALCAVESDEKVGDIYLDDGMHGALMTKCAEDFNEMFSDSMCRALPVDEHLSELMRTQKVRDAKEEFLKWDEQRHEEAKVTPTFDKRGLPCPHCRYGKLRAVSDTKCVNDYTRRRRACDGCGRLATTYEVSDHPKQATRNESAESGQIIMVAGGKWTYSADNSGGLKTDDQFGLYGR